MDETRSPKPFGSISQKRLIKTLTRVEALGTDIMRRKSYWILIQKATCSSWDIVMGKAIRGRARGEGGKNGWRKVHTGAGKGCEEYAHGVHVKILHDEISQKNHRGAESFASLAERGSEGKSR